MKMQLEIRSAEGGLDSKLFVHDMGKAYVRLALRLGWMHRVILDRHGEMHLIFEGPPETINQLLNEPGGHRLQRTPPSERRGRVHTSTITVAVLPVSNENLPASFRLADPDISVEWFSGTGAGGQHRNKHQNSVRLTHLPSVITETSQQRSREASYKDALQRLTQRVAEREASLLSGVRAGVRKTQVGSGMRGDKIRTYRFQDDTAHDHQSGKKASLERVMAGHFELLWR